MLERHSNSELHRLRLLHAILNNDFQEAYSLLLVAIKEGMRDQELNLNIIP